MKNRQYSVRVYDTQIENEEEFIKFFKTNYILLKNNIIFLRGEVSEKIRLFLQSLSLDFIINPTLSKSDKKNDDFINSDVKKEIEQKERVKKKELIDEKENNQINLEIEKYKKEIAQNQILLNDQSKALVKNNITIIDKIVRSGMQLNIPGDLILFSRVNSAASIYVDGNFISTQLIEGKILCNGFFMLFYSSSKAYIEFHGIELTNSKLKNKLNRVEFKNNEIIIQPVLQEEITWGTL